MDWDDRFGLDNNVSFLLWITKYDNARENELTNWISTLHKDRLPCKLTTHKKDDSRGAFNMNCKVEFESGEKWMVRFPMVGKVVNADEKVEVEVATMKLIRQQTTIPVPEIKAWGMAADNPLGIGPFIALDFIEGISLDTILQNPDARIMRDGISEQIIEVIFRQTIDFLLQLYKLDFACIGSLTSESTISEDGFAAAICSRPLTKKAHDFLVDGGVNVFGPRDKTFLSTTEYFYHVIDRDLQHLYKQINSVDDEHDAKEKYIYFNIMRALIPRHVIPGHDNRPFKLMCDDFQPTNMIVNNEQELKIVAVLDWEWSYTAPIQLANTTPTWLLIESPNAWGSIDERLARFNRHLELYTRIMVEEEPKILGEGVPEDQKPSTLLRACQKGGRQWFHFIMLRGFNGPTCVPFIKLREETEDWDELVAAIPAEDVDAFVQKKMTDLQEYGKQLPEMQERYREALRGDSTERNAFLYKNLDVLSLDSQRREWLSW